MSDNEEDDKATVVLDINALKKEMAQKSASGDMAIDQEIEFSVTPENVGGASSVSENSEDLSLGDDIEEGELLVEDDKRKVILFDLNSEYFTKLSAKLPDTFEYVIIKELKELNKILLAKEEVVIMFNYNAAPKSVNQLTTQIKAKFDHAKTVIIAKGLTPEKAQQHKNSKAGANAYLSVPFNISKFESTVKSV